MPHRRPRPLNHRNRQGTQQLATPQYAPILNPPGAQFFYGSSAATAQITNVPSLTATSTNLQVSTIAGWPVQYPFTLLLEWGTANQEVVTITQGGAGSGPYSFSNVIRGADGTTAVAHATGAQVTHGVSAREYAQRPPVFNVCYWGADPTGFADSGPAIQSALLAASDFGGGGVCHVPAGNYVTSLTLLLPPNVWLRGDGQGSSTISAVSGFSPARNGDNGGMSVLQTNLNTGGNYFRISGITFDGNQPGNLAIPAWADSPECAPVSIWSANNLIIEDVEVIRAIGFSIYLKYCTNFSVVDCKVTSGQYPASGWNQQDGIHVTDSQYGYISGNTVDTGTNPAAGDDGIAIQAYGTCSDMVITGNRVRSAEHGVSVVTSGGAVANVVITDNDIWSTQYEGVILYPDRTGGTLITGVTIAGNTFGVIAASGTANGITLQDYVSIGGSGAGWADVTITGNTFAGVTSSGYGIYAAMGSGLAITGNVLGGMNVGAGIQVGHNTGTTEPVTGFQVHGNTVAMASAAAGKFPLGIQVQDSSDGTISGNTLTGPGSGDGGTYGVKLSAVATAVTGVAVTGNRVTAWSTALAETNAGAVPDYNTFTGNAIHNCVTSIAVTGPHTLCEPAPVDTGGVHDTEQFMALSAAYTLGTGTALQKLLNASTNGALTVGTGLYYFECEFDMSGMSGTTGTFSFGFAGTATISSLKYLAQAQKTAAAGTPGTPQVTVGTAATATALVSTSTTTTGSAYISGAIRVSVAGTIIPSVALSVGIAAVVSTNSWFRIVPVSPVSSAVSAGNWS